MNVVVQLPGVLREFADGRDQLVLEAATMGDALGALVRNHPRLERHLFDERGRLRPYVNAYLNADESRDLPRGLDTPVAGGDVLMIVPSVAGGSDAEDLTRAEVARYSRHLVLPEIGWRGQALLKQARVAVVGAGGLGSPAALYLAAAGVGTIGLIDDDVVDTTNLQRQVLYGTGDVGRPKLEAAAERLRAANPHIQVVRHPLRLTSANALHVLHDYDVVIDGTDNFPTRYLVNDACVLLGKPCVYGSVLRFEGQAAVFDGRDGPCYRCLFREPPPPGLVPDCAEGGVLGVLPGIIGSVQALETIKLITGAGETLKGRIVIFDALGFRWRELRLRKNPECPICGEHPSITRLIDYDIFCGLKGPEMSTGQNPHAIPQITATELKRRLDAGEPITLIDVREPFEWDIANLGQYGAKLIPMDQITDRSAEIDRAGDIVLYCRSGARSAGALRQLRAQGFERLWNLKGGINSWGEEVDPSLPPY
ncbi:MAG TPA: molybdopterin-synthase adenylyltransferase MoeB [Longimicrobiales bacterium]|nr:molybdopterin-synthase adenylyltransferase MoeB [Longimicrobiales bacterium]